jgi:HPt (histidine-containing phosphotransfer) domain-containing protein
VQSTRDDDLSIDLDLTLKLSAQNRKISNELFVMLYDEIPEYVEQVENALESDSNEAMQQAIHKIQGVTRYAGLPVLKRLLDQFESAWAIDPARVTGLAAQINTELKHIRQQLPGLLEGVGGKQ